MGCFKFRRFMKNVSFKLKDVLNDGNYVENCVSIKLLNDLNDIPPLKRPIHCTDKDEKKKFCDKR